MSEPLSHEDSVLFADDGLETVWHEFWTNYGKAMEATTPTKREFTIEIITELITPVVVWATTQEEAEHLALEQFKLAAGEEAASSNSLLSPALEEEIAAIQKIFAEAEGKDDEQ